MMSQNSCRPTPHLILGGSRSGKSLYAEQQMGCLPTPYVYVATAQILDDEMDERVERHRARRGPSWQTIETPLDLVATLTDLQGEHKAVLVDCLTLWLSNLLLYTQGKRPEHALEELCQFLGEVGYPLLLVSNEVGSGIVPENALARRFRDLAGYANQQIARACRAVTLLVSGLPLVLK